MAEEQELRKRKELAEKAEVERIALEWIAKVSAPFFVQIALYVPHLSTWSIHAVLVAMRQTAASLLLMTRRTRSRRPSWGMP